MNEDYIVLASHTQDGLIFELVIPTIGLDQVRKNGGTLSLEARVMARRAEDES